MKIIDVIEQLSQNTDEQDVEFERLIITENELLLVIDGTSYNINEYPYTTKTMQDFINGLHI